jgi:hypothetical protein
MATGSPRGARTRVDSLHCQVFYRPGFGRRGGERRSEFGEFDFIILAGSRLVLAETKWDQSSERIKDGLLELRPEQARRHEVFRFYLEHWAYGGHSSWREFVQKAPPLNGKRLAPGSPLRSLQPFARLATGSPRAPRRRVAPGVPACIPVLQGISSMSRFGELESPWRHTGSPPARHAQSKAVGVLSLRYVPLATMAVTLRSLAPRLAQHGS